MPNHLLPDDHPALAELDLRYQNLRAVIAGGASSDTILLQVSALLEAINAALLVVQSARADAATVESAVTGQLALLEAEEDGHPLELWQQKAVELAQQFRTDLEDALTPDNEKRDETPEQPQAAPETS